MSDPVIGNRLVTDGTTRDVYLDADGRQYVLDGDGVPVYGVWLVPDPADEAIIRDALGGTPADDPLTRLLHKVIEQADDEPVRRWLHRLLDEGGTP